MSTKPLKCPVCGSKLDQAHYDKALGILEAKREALRLAKEKATEKVVKLQVRLAESKEKIKCARAEAAATERNKTQQIIGGKDKQIRKLKEAVDQLKRGVTPQTEGLEFEHRLVDRLKREFPEDEVEHHGRQGDILQKVLFEKGSAGVIVYELKRVERIQDDHIQQTLRAKRDRQADWAVLVHTGRKQGWTGFGQFSGVVVVSPLAVIPAVRLLREYLIQMLRTKITNDERSRIAERLLAFVDGPQFKNPLEDVVRRAGELQETLKEEAKAHFRIWQKRWRSYQAIRWDSQIVAQNVHLLVHGKEPAGDLPFNPQPLALPRLSQ